MGHLTPQALTKNQIHQSTCTVGSHLCAPWGMQVAHTYPWPDAEMSTQPCAHAADICMQSVTKKKHCFTFSSFTSLIGYLKQDILAHAHHWLKYPHGLWIRTGSQPVSAKHRLRSSNLSPFVQLEIPCSNYCLLKNKVNLPCSFSCYYYYLEKIQLRKIRKVRASVLKQSPCINPANKEVTL